MNSKQGAAVEQFHALHESGCFVLPNPWDAGSAIYLESVGFKALATTSAGFAFAQGLPDGGVALDAMLDHFRVIATATSLPVNADFQNCYADDPDEVAENVRRCVETGVAGLSIEDSTGNSATPLYDFDLAVARVKAARTAIDATAIPVVLTARCEAHLVGDPDSMRTSLDRLVAFADVGADCLFAPGVTTAEEIAQIVKAVAPKPINVLVFAKNCNLTLEQLSDLGVRRISLGSSLARAAWTGVTTLAKQIQETGQFTSLGQTTYFDFNKLFREHAHSRRESS
ncbi:MAG TPA: isocitrate lyase/phosphoenolpyruvate mutase family protein [Pyrinomonadaceae bacterium]|nr:isocitrate lyase/phosphoenolpyruvate mutase family protein [Pyrinomonadaceae bacterium]